MRKHRGLAGFSGLLSVTWTELMAQNSPVIVPISPTAFGEKPDDWHPNASLTEFIFLRGGGTPKLAPELLRFLKDAIEAHEPTVVMGFSSMPVGREEIMAIAFKMISEAKCKPRVIALVGQRDLSKEALSSSSQQKADGFIKSGKLYEAPGAPFGLLFELVDCIIMHGGLGTTAEALRAAKPTITTGVLLMDQRFWGQRVADLGVGPPPVHISDFLDHCVDFVDRALLDPPTAWQRQAIAVASKIQAKTPDGVQENVDEIVRLLPYAKPIQIPYKPDKSDESEKKSRPDKSDESEKKSRPEESEKKSRESEPVYCPVMSCASLLPCEKHPQHALEHNRKHEGFVKHTAAIVSEKTAAIRDSASWVKHSTKKALRETAAPVVKMFTPKD